MFLYILNSKNTYSGTAVFIRRIVFNGTLAGLIERQSHASLFIIHMASASRDAKSCVSRAKICLSISCFIALPHWTYLLVRCKILCLYFGRVRNSSGFHCVSALGCGRYGRGDQGLWNGHVMRCGHYFRSRCLRSCGALCGRWCGTVEAMYKYAGMRTDLCSRVCGNS